MLGVKVGKRLYDAGLIMPEKTLVTIGDNCTFNEGVHVQGHSMEDGTFKSDHIAIRNNCSLGVDSWVNYGVIMQDGSSLGADSLLMKGEDVPENATYSGNPAREVTTPAVLPVVASRGPRHKDAVAAAAGRPKLSKGTHGAHGAHATRAAANAVHGTHRASRDKASRDKAGTPGSGS
jgi:serine acetyltransferase